MRYSIFFLLIFCLNVVPVLAANSTDFDSFIKSREVVATLYFQVNSDNLAAVEHQRILQIVSQLRQLQKAGRLIRVEGFSSPEGDQEANFQLSFFRARAVADIITSRGLPAEVTLTGYGDLQAKTDDAVKERRVEIASYIKPVGLKPIKIVEDKHLRATKPDITRVSSGDNVIDSFSVDQALKKKLDERNKNLADRQRMTDPSVSPGISQSSGAEAPIIDALTIEQAIMEKIGAVQPKPSGAVSRVDVDYR